MKKEKEYNPLDPSEYIVYRKLGMYFDAGVFGVRKSLPNEKYKKKIDELLLFIEFWLKKNKGLKVEKETKKIIKILLK